MEARKEDYGGIERRRYPRIHATFVEYSPIREIIPQKKSFTENVSPGGICFLVDEEIGVNTLLSLKIYLPDNRDAIEAKARVVWTKVSSFLSVEKRKHYDLGLEFVEIDENDRQRIWQYIEKHSSEDKSFSDF